MPRNYIRKTNKNEWTESQLKLAIRSIMQPPHLKIREASRKYGIHESTLRKRMKINSVEHMPLGRKPTFTAEKEIMLVDHIINVAKLYYGITPHELRRIAYEFAEANKIKHTFNTTTKLAGKDWLYLFLRRHPHISLRQPESTSLNRITAFNKDSVNHFYSNLSDVLEIFRFKANQVYNVDETGITTVQKKCPKVYAQKGTKKVGAATSTEKGTVTVVFCINAAGNYIPPMLIFPRTRMRPLLERNGPMGAIYGCSKSGWINEDLFIKWLQHFKNYVKPTNEDPVLLILDNHSSHISFAAFQFCKKNYITVITLPPHTSHKLQPLDLTFFGPLKNAFYRECNFFLNTNSYEKITEYNLAELLNKAFIKVATMEKGISGFSLAGIWPFNPDKFDDHDFVPKEITDQELVTEAVPETLNTDENADPNKLNNYANHAIAASSLNGSPSDSTPSTSKIAITEISSVPVRKLKTKVRYSREKMQSEIFTVSPQKQKLQRLEEKKKDSLKKKMNTLEANANRAKKSLKLSTGSKEIKVELLENKKSDVKTENSILPPPNDCIICGEVGSDKKFWLLCCSCFKWVHEECSGANDTENYICDFCLDN